VGATFVSPGEGRSLWVLGELVTCKTRSEQTGGAYSLFEVSMHPGGGPLPHIHHREDESFYVLQGEFEFVVDDSALRAGAGSLIYLPKGTLHAHKNIGEGVGRLLITQTPGGLYEHFFEQVGKAVDGEAALDFEGQLEVERIVKVAAEYGIEIPVPIA
jgi:mannose-6-phosphate isomerase-like protein (cupin superfamily)